jgi:hypothetical protein
MAVDTHPITRNTKQRSAYFDAVTGRVYLERPGYQATLGQERWGHHARVQSRGHFRASKRVPQACPGRPGSSRALSRLLQSERPANEMPAWRRRLSGTVGSVGLPGSWPSIVTDCGVGFSSPPPGASALLPSDHPSPIAHHQSRLPRGT